MRTRLLVLLCNMQVMQVLLSFLCFCAVCGSTPLDDYVNRPDSTYKYDVLDTVIEQDGFTIHYLNMTSQTWLTGTPTHRVVGCVMAASPCRQRQRQVCVVALPGRDRAHDYTAPRHCISLHYWWLQPRQVGCSLCVSMF